MDKILQILLILFIEVIALNQLVASELLSNVKISRFRNTVNQDEATNSSTIGSSPFQASPVRARPNPVQQISRVSYGFSAVEGQFPWQAALLVVSNNRAVSVGGGSVISDEWVLTAGHCVSNALVITVTLGTVDRFRANVRQWSTQFVVHPLYEAMTLNNDIGLIKLPEKMTFTGKFSLLNFRIKFNLYLF